MVIDGCYCGMLEEDCKTPIIQMKYLGKGKYQCPRCKIIEDFSENVYTITLEYYLEKEEDGEEWINVRIVKPYDSRLDFDEKGKPVTPESNKITVKEQIHQDIWDEGFAEGHELGKFETDIFHCWYICSSPEDGTEWDLEMQIITEKKVN